MYGLIPDWPPEGARGAFTGAIQEEVCGNNEMGKTCTVPQTKISRKLINA